MILFIHNWLICDGLFGRYFDWFARIELVCDTEQIRSLDICRLEFFTWGASLDWLWGRLSWKTDGKSRLIRSKELLLSVKVLFHYLRISSKRLDASKITRGSRLFISHVAFAVRFEFSDWLNHHHWTFIAHWERTVRIRMATRTTRVGCPIVSVRLLCTIQVTRFAGVDAACTQQWIRFARLDMLNLSLLRSKISISFCLLLHDFLLDLA